MALVQTITSELNNNSLIKKIILPSLPSADGSKKRAVLSNCYDDYDLSSVEIEGKVLSKTQFISKFMWQNRLLTKSLVLKKLEILSRGGAQLLFMSQL